MNPENFLNQQGKTQIYRPGHDFSNQVDDNRTNRKFKFIPAFEIINNLRPTSWLIKNYIEQHSLTLIFGDPASGKSFIAIDQACCIATGTAWHGHDVGQGAVFYIAGEGHNGLGRRLKAWEQKNSVSLKNAPLYISERPAQLFSEDHARAVAHAVQELVDMTGQKPALIVIDTLARNFGGGDENSTKDMNLFVQHIDEIKDCWRATALIVHHTGHGDKSRARGSIALKGALDHEYQIQKHPGDIVSMQSIKTKDGPDSGSLHFKIVAVPLGNYDDNIPIQGAALERAKGLSQVTRKKLTKQKERGLMTIQDCLTECGVMRHVRSGMQGVFSITLEQARQALKMGNISASDDADNIRRTISKVITDLSDAGAVLTYGDYLWLAEIPDQSKEIP